MSRTTLPFLLVLGALAASASAQRGLEKLQVDSTVVSGNVHLLATGAGGNLAACVGDDGVLLVDAEYEQLAGKVQAALAELSDRPLRYVVDTHWHFDHVGGNARFARSGSVIVAHENVRELMAADQHIGVLDVEIPASPRDAWPTITYSESLTLYMNDEEVFVLHLPAAHTSGDSVVQFRRANVIHAGDIVFQGGYPFIDVTNGGSIDGVIRAVDRIAELCDDDTKIIPGHGAVLDRAELIEYGNMLRQFRQVIAAAIADGKTLDEIQAERPTRDIDDRWGQKRFPPERFREIVFRSLADSR